MGARTPRRTPLERGISRAGKAGERGDLAEPIVERAQRCQRARGPLEEPRTSEVRHLAFGRAWAGLRGLLSADRDIRTGSGSGPRAPRGPVIAPARGKKLAAVPLLQHPLGSGRRAPAAAPAAGGIVFARVSRAFSGPPRLRRAARRAGFNL